MNKFCLQFGLGDFIFQINFPNAVAIMPQLHYQLNNFNETITLPQH